MRNWWTDCEEVMKKIRRNKKMINKLWMIFQEVVQKLWAIYIKFWSSVLIDNIFRYVEELTTSFIIKKTLKGEICTIYFDTRKTKQWYIKYSVFKDCPSL